MKSLLFFLVPISFLIATNACQPEVKVNIHDTQEAVSEITYDSTLAKKLGADDYGMKHYVMAFLKRGPQRDQDSITAAEIQKGHMANINRLAEEGKLVVAGPFEDDGEIRGIFIFNVATLEEAQALTSTDPAVQSGRLIMELHPWYGSAALMEINSLHGKLSKKSF
jgi:uncharacterized protein YciI